MSVTFTKLFSSITESTIWCEDSDTRIVWIAMLAMADKRGRVFGSIPGLANRSRVPVEIARAAIVKFLSPDPDSRSNTYDPSTEGRRIEVIEGGWRLINHSHYREIRDEEERREYLRVKQAEHRANKRQQNKQASTQVNQNQHNAEAEAEAEAEADSRKQKQEPQGVPGVFNETDISISLCREAGIVGMEEIRLVADAVKASGGDHIQTATQLLTNWQKHKDSGKFPQQLKAFIKEGHWKDAPKAKRKYLTMEDEGVTA